MPQIAWVPRGTSNHQSSYGVWSNGGKIVDDTVTSENADKVASNLNKAAEGTAGKYIVIYS